MNDLVKTEIMNSSNGTKRKMFSIATGIFLVTMSSVFFMINENKLDIHPDEIKAFVLQEEVANTPQDETFYRELLQNDHDDLLVLSNESTVEVTSTEFNGIKDQNFFTLVHPEDLPEIGNAFMEATESNDSIGPIRLKASTGEYKPYVISMESLENESGEKISTALVLKDTSRAVGDRGNDIEVPREIKNEVDDNDKDDKRVTDHEDREDREDHDDDNDKDDKRVTDHEDKDDREDQVDDNDKDDKRVTEHDDRDDNKRVTDREDKDNDKRVTDREDRDTTDRDRSDKKPKKRKISDKKR